MLIQFRIDVDPKAVLHIGLVPIDESQTGKSVVFLREGNCLEISAGEDETDDDIDFGQTDDLTGAILTILVDHNAKKVEFTLGDKSSQVPFDADIQYSFNVFCSSKGRFSIL